MPATSRISSRPAPDQPLAYVENKRGNKRTHLEVNKVSCVLKSSKRDSASTLSGVRIPELELNDSALQPDHGSMGPVVSPEFGEDASDSALHGFFGD